MASMVKKEEKKRGMRQVGEVKEDQTHTSETSVIHTFVMFCDADGGDLKLETYRAKYRESKSEFHDIKTNLSFINWIIPCSLPDSFIFDLFLYPAQ